MPERVSGLVLLGPILLLELAKIKWKSAKLSGLALEGVLVL